MTTMVSCNKYDRSLKRCSDCPHSKLHYPIYNCEKYTGCTRDMSVNVTLRTKCVPVKIDG